MSLPLSADADARRLIKIGRIWSIAGGVWALGYLILYLSLTVRLGGEIAWFYVGNLFLGLALIGWSFVVPFGRMLLQIAAVVLAVATIIGLISIGMLLVPAVLLTIFSTRRMYHPLPA